MQRTTIAGWALVAALAVAASQALSQQDEGPILLPRKLPAKPAGATLLVICDLACNWKLDGEAKGHIQAGGSAKANVVIGQHLVVAATPDDLDKVEKEIDIEAIKQTLVRIELTPIQDARLKAKQEARDKAVQEAQDKAGEWFSQGFTLYKQERYEEARPLFEKACDSGIMAACVACNDLGNLYYSGQRVGMDYGQARTLYQKACDGGEMSACNNFGWLYQYGQGVSQDYAQARTLYQKACDSGEMRACSNLGILYQNGQGVSQDYARARTLYQKACKGGVEQACKNLSNLH
jgi:TPR repeat protein